MTTSEQNPGRALVGRMPEQAEALVELWDRQAACGTA